MKNKKIIAIFVIVFTVLTLIIYPKFGKKVIEKNIYEQLYKDGYKESDILFVEVRHSYISGILAYGQWHTSIYFVDEPKVEYHCVLSNDIIPNVLSIYAGGFSVDLPDDYVPTHYPI